PPIAKRAFAPAALLDSLQHGGHPGHCLFVGILQDFEWDGLTGVRARLGTNRVDSSQGHGRRSECSNGGPDQLSLAMLTLTRTEGGGFRHGDSLTSWPVRWATACLRRAWPAAGRAGPRPWRSSSTPRSRF